MKFEVTILGSSSATPIYNRNPTAQILNANEKLFLIDCGEGTQQQMLRYGINVGRVDHIFISHLHGDHYLGLVGLLSSLNLNGRRKPLYVYGPFELQEIIEIQFKYSQTQLQYSLNFISTRVDTSVKIFENIDLVIETIILDHGIPCTGFKFSQKKLPRKINKQKIGELEIPLEQIPSIKKGGTFIDKNGKEYTSEELTIVAAPPKSYAYCSDTLCSWTYLESIREVDLLYHETTFMNNMLKRAEETYHSTTYQAAEIAVKANVKQLLIGHFSARYRKLEPLLEECKTIFENTLLAIEGQSFKI